MYNLPRCSALCSCLIAHHAGGRRTKESLKDDKLCNGYVTGRAPKASQSKCVLRAVRACRFPPTTSGQYLLDRYAETHAGYDSSAKADGDHANRQEL